MSTVPYFKLYVPDWLTDTEGMSIEAQGLFMRLLCYCWLREGLPSNEDELARLVHMDKRKFRRIWKQIEHKFIETSPELLANFSIEVSETSAELLRDFSKTSLQLWNPRLLKEMLQLADKQRKRREAGKIGGLAKARNLLGKKTWQKASIPESESESDITKSIVNNLSIDKSLTPSSRDDDENVSQKRKSKKKRQANGSTEDDPKMFGFDEFWSHYPRKVGKVKARSAWRTQNCAKIASEIIEDVQWRKEYQWEDIEFVPHPTTWINGHRWEDERETAPATAPKPKPHEPRPHIPDVTGCGITERKPLTDDQRDQLREIKQALHGCFRKIEK